MAHIQKVHVKWFGSLRDCVVTFGQDDKPPQILNLIIGGNATGKTSLIEAMLAVHCAAKYYTAEVDVAKPDDWLSTETRYFSSNRRQSPVGGVQISPRESRESECERNRILQFVTSILKHQTRRASPRWADTAKDQEWLSRLNDFWNHFRNNGTSLDVDYINPNDLSMEQTMFLFKGDERICSVDDMSAGEIDAIAFAVPFITMPAPFDGVVLIDDVEAYMTQEWATSLLTALRTMLPEAQFIVTTRLTGWTLPDCAMYDMGAITGKA